MTETPAVPLPTCPSCGGRPDRAQETGTSFLRNTVILDCPKCGEYEVPKKAFLGVGERIFPQNSEKADPIAEMIARLRNFAETDADIRSWVGSDILAACDLIEELRTKVQEVKP